MKKISSIGAIALCVSFSATTNAQTSDDDDTLEEVIVTGSRIVQDGSQAPTPVTAVGTEVLAAAAPTNIPDGLNKLPQFAGSTSESRGESFNAGSTPMGNYMNLRSLESSRVLVLLDGQRVTPTDRTNAVDVNVLPQMLVERVEIVTGGASAVYGSDAVSGVVNWILDDDYEGVKVNAQVGTTSRADADSYRVGIAGGLPFGDRFHFVGSVETYDNDGVSGLYERSWAADTFGTNFFVQPQTFVPEVTRNAISNNGTVFVGPLGEFYPDQDQNGRTIPTFTRFNPDGTISPMDMGTFLVREWSSGGDGGRWGEPRNGGTSIAGTIETLQSFGRLTMEINDTTEAYVQGIYSTSDTSFSSTPNNHIWNNQRESRIIFNDPVNGYENPYLDPLRNAAPGTDEANAWQALQASGEEYFILGRIFNDIPLVKNQTENEYVSFQAALSGQFNDNWQWNATYNYGEATQDVVWDEFQMREFYAAIDAVRDPATGQTVCGVTLRNPGFMDDCVPMNIIGDGNISQAAFDYTRGNPAWTITNEMQYLNFNVIGDIFELPAGPVGLAFGAEYRTQDLLIVSGDADPAFWSTPDGVDTAARDAYFGILPDGTKTIATVPNDEAGYGAIYDSISQGSASGDQSITEFYLESNIPVFEGGILSLAARQTDYETSGSVTTWKIGASWAPVDSFRLRLNQSRDIAAPGLNALFAGENVFFSGFADTHMEDPNDQNAVPLISQSGNPNLEPEEADTTTIGIVYQPEWAEGMTLSVDYYRVKLDGAIATPSTQALFEECEASQGQAAACDRFIRNPNLPWSDRTIANRVTKILEIQSNLALLETSGIDINFTWDIPLDFGDLTLRAYLNYLDTFETQTDASAPVVDWVGYQYTAANTSQGMPKWKGLLSQTFTTENFSATLFQRFTGSYLFGNPTSNFAYPLTLPNKTYIDLDLNYAFGRDRNLVAFFNVQNLFDVEPPLVPNAVVNLTVPTVKPDYDVLGTNFAIGLRAQF